MKPETFAKRFPELSSSLAPDDLEAVIGAFELHDADAGEALVAEGTTTDELFLVWDGELAITMSGPAGVRPLAGVAPGSYFGEASLLDPGPAEASVVSEQGCVALRMSRARFDAICDSNPRAARALLGEVIRSLAERLRGASAYLGGQGSGEPAVPTSGESDDLPAAIAAGTQLARAFRDVTRQVRTRVEAGGEAAVKDYDVVVIGAGPHALAYAVWIKQERPETRIALVDKRAAPGFKIGESTLGPVVRAVMSMGVPIPVMRRLFNNKLGLHFWWMGADSDVLHGHVDHVIEETYQLERRVFELLMLNVARRAGVDIYQGAKALIDESRIDGQPKELVCETESGDTLRFRSPILCDASGQAALIGRRRGLRRKWRDFNTNAYWGYFRKRSDVDIPEWDVPATRHLCFPEGWVWFIELASWERAPDENLNALIDHLLDIGSPDEGAYPTRYELAERFDAPLDQWPVSIGVVPRTDIDTAADLPVKERFQHYVDRYPVFKRIMDTFELIEEPYEGHPSYIAYTEITQHSDRYAGDGWLLIGDAAFFVNPLYSPGLTYGHSLASFAAAETVKALDAGDFSEAAFERFDQAARGLFDALVTECEAWYRSFRHMEAYERMLLFRVAYFIGMQHERILQFGGAQAMRQMRPIRPLGPHAEPITNPRYTQVLREAIGAMRVLEEQDADPAETARAVKAILDPLIDEVRAMDGVAALHLGEAFQNYDDRFQRVPRKEPWDSLVPAWRCARCENNNPVEFGACYVCGDSAPAGAHRMPVEVAMPAGQAFRPG